MRFELIDQVLEQSDARLVAVKSVTAAEEYLGDHFPGFAVFPGVMMLETLTQAGRRLLAACSLLSEQDRPGPWVLGSARNVRYGNMVRPGQSLRVEVALRKADGPLDPAAGIELTGKGHVGEQVAIQGRLKLVKLTTESN